ncbi:MULTISPECIES: MFS transporter [unclassified Bacillus (in: firmicutes)]|uniref:MFS transporter n=1 Tax=unclassified Bacillus (in: firmicutes) TaxID=185979 RepID=UPI001BE62717|nr:MULTISPECIES: MFS transporter [unclassified Bacillus (in: firmicutes)]MBT2728134.1 MFS transporter [Bacillus sp. ISL-75]MBT2734752.1 MFS transporter [Bacillus sp. ISL-7]
MTKSNNLLILILVIGVFGILSTEMGFVGILPVIADTFHISVSKAGLLVSLFALVVAISGPTMPLMFSGINRKKVMLLVLGIFILGNIVSMLTSNFTILLISRVIPAFFHPIYISLALTVAATSGTPEEARKSISKIMMAVSAGMILGVPIVTFIANVASLEMAMSFFAIVNAIAFIVTLLFVPSMPVEHRISYGAQVSVLKKPIIWLSIATVIFINSAVSGVYSYVAEYLENFAHISGKTLSLVLFLFGITSLVGNIVAGRLLAKNTLKTVVTFPIVLGLVYILAFLMTNFIGPIAIIFVLIWGVLFAIGNNISQYWIASAAPEAPDFANGLFLTCGNLGITIGTAVSGLIISGMGVQYVLLVGSLFLLLGLSSIILRTYMNSPIKQLSK